MQRTRASSGCGCARVGMGGGRTPLDLDEKLGEDLGPIVHIELLPGRAERRVPARGKLGRGGRPGLQHLHVPHEHAAEQDVVRLGAPTARARRPRRCGGSPQRGGGVSSVLANDGRQGAERSPLLLARRVPATDRPRQGR